MWIGYFIKKQNETKMDRGMFSFVFPPVVHLFFVYSLVKRGRNVAKCILQTCCILAEQKTFVGLSQTFKPLEYNRLMLRVAAVRSALWPVAFYQFSVTFCEDCYVSNCQKRT